MSEIHVGRRIAGAAAGCLLVLIAGGCFGGAGQLGPDPVERYIRLNPQLSAPVRDALRAGCVAEGMSRPEVRLSMGPPQRRETVGEAGAGAREVWIYNQRPSQDVLRGSQLWHTDVPMARVVFGPDRRVESWRLFSPDEPFRPDIYIDDGAREAALKAVQGPTEPPAAPRRPLPGPRGTFEDWPQLQITGVSLGGQQATAILNRQVVAAGDDVEGVRVLAVIPEGVWLRYRGSDQFLPLR